MKYAWLAAAALLTSSPAFAQGITQVPNKAPMTTTAVARAVGGAPFTASGDARSGGERRVETGPAGAAALQAFSFEFGNGDHSIKTIRASRRASETSLNFADNDGNDPFTASATYLPLSPQFQARKVNRTGCPEVCYLSGDIPKDQVLVLTGFSLERTGTDADMVNFSIVSYPQYGTFVVEFEDSNERIRMFDVQIEYVAIPRDLVGERAMCSSGSNCALGANWQNNAMEGFKCSYRAGSSANLLATAIDARSKTNLSRFQDNDTAEGGRCTVMLATLK